MPVTLVNDEAAPASVTARILAAFLDALAAEDGCAEVAERLREAMLARGDLSERSLRSALFGSEAP